MKNTRCARAIPLLAAAALALAPCGCSDSAVHPALSSLRIGSIIAPPGTVLQIALDSTDNPFVSGKACCVSYDAAAAPSPAVLVSGIEWVPGNFDTNDNADAAREFWLFVAEDSNANGLFDRADRAMPAMKILLRDGQETAIETLDFTNASMLVTGPSRTFTIGVFMSEPEKIDAMRPVRVLLGTEPDMSSALPVSAPSSFIFCDSDVLSELSFRVDSSVFTLATGIYVFVFWDSDNSGTVPTAGDYISDPSILNARNLSIGNDSTFVLSPLLVQP